MSVNKNVLLVNGDKSSSHLGTVLQRMGFGVSSAASGSDALKQARQNPPNLILINTGKSSSFGPDTLRAIRKDEYFNTTPAIVLYQELDEKTLSRCTEAGSNGFLSRPVRLEVLHEVVQESVFRKAGFRRRHMRVNAGVRVLMTKDGEVSQFMTETISEGGLYVRTDRPYPVVSNVEVSLRAPDRDMKLKGWVLYHNSMLGDKVTVPGMAIEFIGMNEDDTASLRQLVLGLVTRDMGSDASVAIRIAAAGGGAYSGLQARM